MTYSLEIQAIARELLEGGEVACVIGYEVGRRGRTRPAFVYDADDAERLAWNLDCTHNLTAYLQEKLKPAGGRLNEKKEAQRVAVVVKACDSRALNVLMAENHLQRQQVHVIGVVCAGIREQNGWQEAAAEPDPLLQARCQRCADRRPVVYDSLIGELPSGLEQVLDETSQDLARLQAMTPAERAEFWLSQFDRCIRCYACRQACPMCSCPTCLYERDDSLWVGMGIGLNEKRAFHLGRAFHLAGRCIGCEECERVCPMEIPISLLHRLLAQEVEAAYGYRAGLAPTPAPFVTVLSGSQS